MADVDVTFELTKATDEAVPQRDGSFKRHKSFVFYLGKYGPFTEKIPSDNYDESELRRRVEKLQQHLRMVHL